MMGLVAKTSEIGITEYSIFHPTAIKRNGPHLVLITRAFVETWV